MRQEGGDTGRYVVLFVTESKCGDQVRDEGCLSQHVPYFCEKISGIEMSFSPSLPVFPLLTYITPHLHTDPARFHTLGLLAGRIHLRPAPWLVAD